MANVFINELHYDNDGTDTGEAIEIAGLASTDLTGWSIVLYNGNGGAVYDTRSLSGVIPNQQNGFGTLSFTYPTNGIQNGSPDGIALVDNSGAVIQFLSYEGVFTAVGGAANGLTSNDIGVSETATTPIGFSLQLTGTGSTYTDFTWNSPADDNFGNVNTGQTFTGTVPAGVTITQSGGSTNVNEAGQTTDTYTIALNTTPSSAVTIAISADAQTQISTDGTNFSNSVNVTLNNTNPATITVRAVDDTTVENSPHTGVITHTITNSSDPAYSNLSIPNLNVNITDNDAPAVLIRDIQGTSHISPLVGQTVTNVSGIVTAVLSSGGGRGFYIQDPNPDNNEATSEGIFVFLGNSANPNPTIGQSVQVTGRVDEFRPGNDNENLTITQINTTVSGGSVSTIASLGTITPTIIATGGRTPPTEVINDDFTTTSNIETGGDFQPAIEGIDFYESLEGMLVQVPNPVAVSPTNNFGEIWVLGNNGAGATGVSDRGSIVIGERDFNPERIQIDDTLTSTSPDVNVGAQLNNITGIVSYSFDNYEVLSTSPITVATPSNLQQEVTNLESTNPNQLTIANFNVENLDPSDSARFASLADIIVDNLKTPDILNLIEVQDNNGATNDSVVDANVTFQTLIDAIVATGGPRYEFRQINPVDDQDGGQPGGNIRVGFLFNPNRVDFVDRPGGGSTVDTTVINNNGTPQLSSSPGRILDTDSSNGNAFENSRKPLVGEFLFNGRTIFVVGNHFTSRIGDDPLFGRFQPPNLVTEAQREQQAQEVRDFVEDILAVNPNANVAVLGDFNEFQFFDPLEILESAGLSNLTETLPEDERYTFNFQGNAQALDHILVSQNLFKNFGGYDIVHVNSEFVDPVSDHDPGVALFNLPRSVINGRPGRDTLTGTFEGDTITGFQGRDTITTGAGNDLIVYTRMGDGGDTITDFTVGADKLVFTELLDRVGYSGTNAIADGFIGFEQRGANAVVLFDRNGSGNDPQRAFVTLENVSVNDLNNINNFVF